MKKPRIITGKTVIDWGSHFGPGLGFGRRIDWNELLLFLAMIASFVNVIALFLGLC